MKRHLLFTFFILAIAINFTSAQTVIWPDPNDAQQVKNSQFDGGLNDWTTFGDPAAAVWVWDANGKADEGSYYGTRPAINSPSVGNGVALFNSDYYDSKAGVAIPHVSELVSPVISCAGHDKVFLKFNSYMRRWSENTNNQGCIFYAVSNDGGVNWSDEQVMEIEVPLWESKGESVIHLEDISAIAGDKANVKVKFIWRAKYYFWLIDDVEIVSDPGPDVVIDGSWYPSNWFNLPKDFIGNDSMYFRMYVVNRGSQDATGVNGSVTLYNTTNDVSYFTDDLTFDIGAGDTARIDFKSFLPNASEMEAGLYFTQFEIDNENFYTEYGKYYNQYFYLNENIEVAPNEYENEFSVGDSRHGQAVTWQDGTSEQWNCNYYKAAEYTVNPSVVYTIDSVYYEMAGVTDFSPYFNMFEVNDTVNNQFYNFDFETDPYNEDGQLKLVGYGSDNVFGYEAYTVSPLVVYNTEDSGGILLEPQKKYIGCFIWSSDQIYFQTYDNWYGENTRFYEFSDYSGYLDQRTSFLYTNSNSGMRFYTVGNQIGAWYIPMHLSVTISATIDQLLPDNTVTLVKNPVRNELSVDINFDQVQDEGTMIISNLKGALINLRNFNNLQSDTETFNVSNLPAGEYIFTIYTKEKLLSKKFVVVK